MNAKTKKLVMLIELEIQKCLMPVIQQEFIAALKRIHDGFCASVGEQKILSLTSLPAWRSQAGVFSNKYLYRLISFTELHDINFEPAQSSGPLHKAIRETVRRRQNTTHKTAQRLLASAHYV